MTQEFDASFRQRKLSTARQPMMLPVKKPTIELPHPRCASCGEEIDFEHFVTMLILESGISPRWGEVVFALCKGLATEEMADLLDITIKTVKDHLSAIFKHLGINSRAELLAKIFTPGSTCRCGEKIDFDGIVRQAAVLARLPDAQTLVLVELFHGLTSKEIALAVGTEEKSVKHRISAIFDKFDVSSRNELFNLVYPL